MIKIVQERQVRPGKERALENLLIELRTKGMRQSGYVTGERMIRLDNPSIYLTIGTWTRVEAWKTWENSRERQEIVQLIMPLLAEEPKVTIFGTPLEGDVST